MDNAKTRVLLVEDNHLIVKGISLGLPPEVELTVAMTRYDAEKAMMTDHGFEMVLLDGRLGNGSTSKGLARLALNTQERVRCVVAISADQELVAELLSE